MPPPHSRPLRPRHVEAVRALLQIRDLDLDLSLRELTIDLNLPRSHCARE